MKGTAVAGITACAVMLAGCVSSGTHQRTLAELEAARKTSTQTADTFETFKKQAAAQADGLINQLQTAQQQLTNAEKALNNASVRLASLEKEKEQLTAAMTQSLDEARDLSTKLESERDQEIGKLRQAASDREALASKVAALTQARDQLAAEVRNQEEAGKAQEERLKAEEAAKVRLEQERAAKEAEIKRLTQTHADLTKSLEAEIAKGDIRIKQVRDRLTINMVDRVLFDSGQGQVKPAGLKVLKQVSDILKNVNDKQIRIEGHTDNVPIGGKLKSRFPSNWELSTARATSVVRYLIEQGGVDRAHLSAVGYADMRPVAGNDTEEGRTANRRIEITLYPKDLSEIASQIKP